MLEGFVAFEREISVIAARGLDGEVAAFDPGENVHRDGILAPHHACRRGSPPAVAQDAVLIAGRILNALDYVGVIGVELFVTRGGLVVNEIAPRVHNSGHWTEAACLIDQFEQHVRAICGWPLGDGARHSDAEMLNLIGDEAAAAPEITGARVHLYGKAEARPGRKMGHVTRIAPQRRAVSGPRLAVRAVVLDARAAAAGQRLSRRGERPLVRARRRRRAGAEPRREPAARGGRGDRARDRARAAPRASRSSTTPTTASTRSTSSMPPGWPARRTPRCCAIPPGW